MRNFIKKETPTKKKLFWEIFKNIFFIEHLRATASNYIHYIRKYSTSQWR